MNRCRVYDDPQAGSQTVPVSATSESPCCLRQVAVKPCFALKLQATLSSTAHNLCAANFLSTSQNEVFLYLKLHIACTLFSLGVTHSLSPSLHTSPSVCQHSSAAGSDPPLFFLSILGERPLSVINVWRVAVYVSNHP